MSIENRDQFDAGAYWRDRVISGSDLAIVGHRSMGSAYNEEIYARRIEALEKFLPDLAIPAIDDTKILDVGCGSGFYTSFWQNLGITRYLGLDISADTVNHLSREYPAYQFHQADISGNLPDAVLTYGAFDVATVFDVLYHIVEDQKFESAIVNLGKAVKVGGYLLVMDQLHRRSYQISRHVKYRDREYYLSEFEKQSFRLVSNELLFHFLVPPVTGIRALDYIAAIAFRLTGMAVKNSSPVSRWLASSMRKVDGWLRKHNVRISNSELLVFKKF